MEEVPISQLEFYTNASGSGGFDAFFQGAWTAEPLLASWGQLDLLQNMTLLELFLIMVAVELWGEELRNRPVIFWTDNMSLHVFPR